MKTSLFKSLYFQVLTAIAIGILLGDLLYRRDGHRWHGKHEGGRSYRCSGASLF